MNNNSFRNSFYHHKLSCISRRLLERKREILLAFVLLAKMTDLLWNSSKIEYRFWDVFIWKIHERYWWSVYFTLLSKTVVLLRAPFMTGHTQISRNILSLIMISFWMSKFNKKINWNLKKYKIKNLFLFRIRINYLLGLLLIKLLDSESFSDCKGVVPLFERFVDYTVMTGNYLLN